ncbi:hypothetical protein FQ192_07185 [Pseudomonas sp. ANT_J12]|nr:hypothetical protein FQ192_07185 [Pseudomonas sp. ANT_J12]
MLQTCFCGEGLAPVRLRSSRKICKRRCPGQKKSWGGSATQRGQAPRHMKLSSHSNLFATNPCPA